MNAIRFSEILTDIPEEFIESAAELHGKPIRWYRISAIAACIVLLISAAVYPRLRTQPPELTVPMAEQSTAATTVTTAPEQSEVRKSNSTTAQTTLSSATESRHISETLTTLFAADTTKITPETNPATVTDAPPETTPTTVPENQPVETEGKQESADSPAETIPATTTFAEEIFPITVTTTRTNVLETVPVSQPNQTVDTPDSPEPQKVKAPIWKGEIRHPVSTPDSFFGTLLNTSLSLYEGDVDASLRILYGIPQDYDLTNRQWLLIRIETSYSHAVIADLHTAENGLRVTVAYADDGTPPEYQMIHYVIPIPEQCRMDAQNCSADAVSVTDAAWLADMECDYLLFEIPDESEGS